MDLTTDTIWTLRDYEPGRDGTVSTHKGPLAELLASPPRNNRSFALALKRAFEGHGRGAFATILDSASSAINWDRVAAALRQTPEDIRMTPRNRALINALASFDDGPIAILISNPPETIREFAEDLASAFAGIVDRFYSTHVSMLHGNSLMSQFVADNMEVTGINWRLVAWALKSGYRPEQGTPVFSDADLAGV